MRNQDKALTPLMISNLFLFITLVFLSIWISYSGNTYWSDAALKDFWVQMADLSVFFAALSVSLWLIKKIILVLKKKGATRVSRVNGTTLLLLRNAHITGGWLAFALGLGHSLFFFLRLPWGSNPVDTGIITLTAMTLLFTFGLLYQYKRSKVTVRSWHLILAVIFSLFLIMHM